MLAAHWWWLRRDPHMIVKHFGGTAIHNKALYKCLIHSFIHSCLCSLPGASSRQPVTCPLFGWWTQVREPLILQTEQQRVQLSCPHRELFWPATYVCLITEKSCLLFYSSVSYYKVYVAYNFKILVVIGVMLAVIICILLHFHFCLYPLIWLKPNLLFQQSLVPEHLALCSHDNVKLHI